MLEVEERKTLDQIQLEYHFLSREKLRANKTQHAMFRDVIFEALGAVFKKR